MSIASEMISAAGMAGKALSAWSAGDLAGLESTVDRGLAVCSAGQRTRKHCDEHLDMLEGVFRQLRHVLDAGSLTSPSSRDTLRACYVLLQHLSREAGAPAGYSARTAR